MLIGEKQFVSFIEPHGLLHEGSASDKAQFHLRIKDVEKTVEWIVPSQPSVIIRWF